ncbi:MaoC family dehydratase [Natronococcus jeotgali]|uniref:MaoC domain-containing protein dehydratase n=1 Tax=Natronococcus jeotgali DSM 18795 TaxID=1227498 RepID=L9XCD8_9EURY|nr:MaoC family dehydratase [Natronococcus jeotgali]ELY58288.1 MaoC domain-containing protein dehydratase [Natronococcus jeotgali DSM 18795]
MRYFEDFAVGETREFGEYEVTEEEVIEFAERYDPQPFHVDAEAAADSMFGQLVASGWHTAAISMRLLVEGPDDEDDWASMGSPGVDELRWHQPVKPGDTLSVRTEVLEKRASESRSDRGYLRSRLETHNGDDELVMHWIGSTILERRDHE